MRLKVGLSQALAFVVALPFYPAHAQPVPFMQPIAGLVTTTPTSTATQNVLALNTAMFDLYGAAGIPAEYPRPTPAHSRHVLGGWRPLYPVSSRPAAARGAPGSHHLPDD